MDNKSRNVFFTAEVKDSIQPPKTQLVELNSRPSRLAFIIDERICKENFFKLIKYLSSIWGGYYSLLVPTNGKVIDKFWWENIGIFRPDIIVFCGDSNPSNLEPQLAKKIEEEFSPFDFLQIDDWTEEKDFLNLKFERKADHLIKSIPIINCLDEVISKLRGQITEETSRFSIPIIDRSNPFALSVGLKFGLLSDRLQEILQNVFKAKFVNFSSNMVDEFIIKTNEFINRLDPINFTRIHCTNSFTLIHWKDVHPDGIVIIIFGKRWVQDSCDFWNLHLAEPRFGESLQYSDKDLIIPELFINSPSKIKKFISNFKNDGICPTKKIFLYSSSLTRKKLIKIQSLMQTEIGTQALINVIENRIPTGMINTKCTKVITEAQFLGNKFQIPSISPSFSYSFDEGEWVVDIKFLPQFELPEIPECNYLLSGSPKGFQNPWYRGYSIRYFNEMFIHKLNKNTPFIRGVIPDAKISFAKIFTKYGFETNPSEKHKYSEALINMIGDTKILQEENLRELFWKMVTGKTFDLDVMKSILRNGFKSEEIINTLIIKHLLIRGMNITCDYCGLSQFYSLKILDEEIQCQGCLRIIQPPLKSRIVFKLNELARRAVSQGSIPVLLTRNLFQNLYLNKPLEFYGMEVINGSEKTDIDFITTFHEDIVLIECKDFKHGMITKEKNLTFAQVRKLIKVSKQINAGIIGLSLLLPFEDPFFCDFIEFIKALNRNPKNPIVHLISLKKMEIVDLKNPSKKIEHPDLRFRYC